jgi:hypothetical protein
MDQLMAGFVTSADTGNEDLIIASRAALCDFCSEAGPDRDGLCAALVRNLKNRQGQDRVMLPTLEVVAFLFHSGVFVTSNYKALCLQVQKACYKTGNVRKIEACIKVYGAVASLGESDAVVDANTRRAEGQKEARKRLGGLMSHPWPRVRSLVIDEIWGLAILGLVANQDVGQQLTRFDWGKADKEAIRSLVHTLGMD